MSLTSAMLTGASGLTTYSNAINVIGNNIANVNTVGFKDARTNFSDLLSQSIGNNSQVGAGVQVQSVQNLFTQGTTQSSENVTDLAIQGNSFFALAAPNATAAPATQDLAYLTRAGSFRVNSAFNLVNPDGYEALQSVDGKPILFQHTASGGTPAAGDFAKITAVDSQGVITYSDYAGNTYYYAGNGNPGVAATTANYSTVKSGGFTVAVINPSNPLGLNKVGGTLFTSTADTGIPTTAFNTTANQVNGTSEKLYSNSLELSNVDMAAQFVQMILTQRAYSANSKTITTADQMTQEVLNLKQ